MSLVQNTSVYQAPKQIADRKHSEYGLALALVCIMAVALVAASAVVAPAHIDNGISSEALAVGP